MYSLSYSNLTEIKDIHSETHLTGSSKYVHINNTFQVRKKDVDKSEIKGNIYNNYITAVNFCQRWNLKYDKEEMATFADYGIEYYSYINRYKTVADYIHGKKQGKKRTYKLNKTKVRKKISALCRTDQAKSFLAFYSISFPMHAKDSVIYTMFNKWLTNCRTRYNLNTYLWVAERQENNTLHFHLLTTNRMDITKVNKAMANAIDTEVKKGNCNWGSSDKFKYNGVDVESVQKPKKRQNETRASYRYKLARRQNIDKREIYRWISWYLTKYVTKNDIIFEKLPWHCSRDVSALFTSIVISECDIEYYTQHLSDVVEEYKIYNIDNKTIYMFIKQQSDIPFWYIDKINNLIIDDKCNQLNET